MLINSAVLGMCVHSGASLSELYYAMIKEKYFVMAIMNGMSQVGVSRIELYYRLHMIIQSSKRHKL